MRIAKEITITFYYDVPQAETLAEAVISAMSPLARPAGFTVAGGASFRLAGEEEPECVLGAGRPAVEISSGCPEVLQ